MEEEIKTFVTNLCRDSDLDNTEKTAILLYWKNKLETRNNGKIMRGREFKSYVDSLEILDNAMKYLITPYRRRHE